MSWFGDTLQPWRSNNTQSNENNMTEHTINQPDLDDWETQVQSALHNNLAFEKDLFQPGMSVTDLMELYAKAEPFDNVEQWTRGFAFTATTFCPTLWNIIGFVRLNT
ncbi:expressed unknown protein [Seminavis robusta]|uniref:Uncharacterized protein n=1 Tax=Seminavis robusta TaxID=568900 RepID=A0A9N8HIS7_9STRA|nr:expressed unknown protein [Seminavis robusta]|eukprot:Sro718_g192150.1 n/a (107) ;mRNA; r:9940-10260